MVNGTKIIATAYITPGSTWQNRFVESFNNRSVDGFMNTKALSAGEAMPQVEQHRIETNTVGPHLEHQARMPLVLIHQWNTA